VCRVPRAALNALLVTAFVGLIPGCVIGRSSRPTATESAQGPLAPPVTGAPVVPATLAENSDAPPDKAKPGAVWVQGYWHWDGVKYVWQRGRWQQADRN
jgi:hypothetical protein